MTIDRVRYTRQMRLPEIGEAGQARLSAAVVAPSGRGFARTIEETYLRAAGIGRLGDDGIAPGATVDADALGIRDAAARAVAEGALRALAAVRTVVGS